MPERPEDLPEFRNPPVVEVVLGIQFARIAGFGSVHPGLLWEVFRSEFPIWRDMPPLAPTFEVFASQGGPEFSIEISPAGEMPSRLWLLNQGETKLIQLQSDRFIHNWRKIGPAETYPRYENIRAGFEKSTIRLIDFLRKHNLPPIRPNQCEITYVNHIVVPPSEVWQETPSAVFRFWNDDYHDEAICKVEDVRVLLRHIIHDDGGKPVARLLIQAEPATRADGQKIIVMNVTVRGRPPGEDLNAALSFIDMGREKIVRQFTAVTTAKMHNLWNRLR